MMSTGRYNQGGQDRGPRWGAQDGGAQDGGAQDGGAQDGGAQDGGAQDGGSPRWGTERANFMESGILLLHHTSLLQFPIQKDT